jgi:hypothetical protein
MAVNLMHEVESDLTQTEILLQVLQKCQFSETLTLFTDKFYDKIENGVLKPTPNSFYRERSNDGLIKFVEQKALNIFSSCHISLGSPLSRRKTKNLLSVDHKVEGLSFFVETRFLQHRCSSVALRKMAATTENERYAL